MGEQFLEDLGLFVAIVEAGSLSGAARTLSLSKSAVSTRLRRLEAELGVPLLTRTTRSMRLTDAGRRFHARALDIVTAAEEARREAQELGDVPAGQLRVAAPVSFGIRHLGTVVSDFLAAHPRVQVDLDLSDRRVDLVAEGYDVAVRVGELPDSSLRARKLMDARMRLVAADSYLRQHGRPRRVADLAQHECLLYRHLPTGHRWFFGSGDDRIAVAVHGRLHSDSGDLLAEAACRGLGIALLPDFIVDPPIAEGRLRTLLQRRCQTDIPVHALYSAAPKLSRTLRVFVDALAASFDRRPNMRAMQA